MQEATNYRFSLFFTHKNSVGLVRLCFMKNNYREQLQTNCRYCCCHMEVKTLQTTTSSKLLN